ncbi:SGNH/GDSL hydrolase family protein [Enterococcus sp. LJL120]
MFDKHNRLVFVGDSITDCNRNYNTTIGAVDSLGEGYVSLINAYTTAFHPEKELMIINQGVGGNRVTDLKARWQEILALKPDYLTIMIGINDVWRHFDNKFTQIEQVNKILFEQTYTELIKQSLAAHSKIILLSAFMLEANNLDPMKQMVAEYNEITKKIAANFSLTYIDIQAEMDKFTAIQSSYALSSDRVHLSLPGHAIIAKSWLEAVDLDR